MTSILLLLIITQYSQYSIPLYKFLLDFIHCKKLRFMLTYNVSYAIGPESSARAEHNDIITTYDKDANMQ